MGREEQSFVKQGRFRHFGPRGRRVIAKALWEFEL